MTVGLYLHLFICTGKAVRLDLIGFITEYTGDTASALCNNNTRVTELRGRLVESWNNDNQTHTTQN